MRQCTVEELRDILLECVARHTNMHRYAKSLSGPELLVEFTDYKTEAGLRIIASSKWMAILQEAVNS